MEALSLTLGLQIVALIFLGSSVGLVLVLWRGCKVLRQMARGSVRDDTPILLKSPRVPACSVVAVARDATPQTLGFVRRLQE